jgi:4-amino-4-deoxy-L-arabinose transferase-like glycosyltransferase
VNHPTRSGPLHESEAVRQATLGHHALTATTDAASRERRGTTAPAYAGLTPGVAGTPDGPPLRRRALGPGLTLLVATLSAIVVTVVHARGMYTAPIRFDDEGTYVSQALAVLRDGDLAPYTYWYDHPPLGWVIIAGWFGVPGVLDSAPNLIGAGRSLMLVAGAATALLSFVLVRRLGASRAAAAAAMLLGALSPLAMQFHRMVLLDNLAVPLLLAAFVLVLSPRRRLSAVLLAGVCAGSAVLVKETTLLLLPFVLWSLWQHAAAETRRMCLMVFAVGSLLMVSLYPLFALSKGELLPGDGHVSLVDAVRYQLGGRIGSGSVLDSGSDARAIVSGWLAADPYLVPMGGAAAVAVLLVRTARLRAARPVAAALVVSLLLLLRTGYLPVPYVIVLLPLAAVVLAVGVDALVQRLGRRTLVDLERGIRRTGRLRITSAAAALVAAVAMISATAGLVAPGWFYRVQAAQEVDFDLPYRQAAAGIREEVPRTSTVVVDNVLWTDLEGDGYDGLVWFTKLDADPDVARVITDWSDVDYVAATQIMYTSRESGPTLRALLDHSTVVESWGSGDQRVDLRKVQR